jgi:hypothetical protein
MSTFQKTGAQLHPVIKLYLKLRSLIKFSGLGELLFNPLADHARPCTRDDITGFKTVGTKKGAEAPED